MSVFDTLLITKRGRFKRKHKDKINEVYHKGKYTRKESGDILFCISEYVKMIEPNTKFIADQIHGYASRRTAHKTRVPNAFALNVFMDSHRGILWETFRISYVKERHDGHLWLLEAEESEND